MPIQFPLAQSFVKKVVGNQQAIHAGLLFDKPFSLISKV